MRSALQIEFPIAAIQIGERLRQLDEAQVQNLMVVIAESDFQGTISLRAMPSLNGQPSARLVAGRHRLEAMRRLGRETIPSSVRHYTDDEALQAEIDENLIRKGLTALERAEMVLARLQVWARLNPDRVTAADGQAAPKRGRPVNSVNLTELSGGAPPAMGFTAETACDLGFSEETLRRALAVTRGLGGGVRARLHGTWVAKNDAVLRQLAGMPDRDEQVRVVEQLLDHDVRNFGDARDRANGRTPVKAPQTPVDETLKALKDTWAKAPQSHRDAMMDWLAGNARGWRVERLNADG